jgi:uncharacterized LabA/DUF88 family protein
MGRLVSFIDAGFLEAEGRKAVKPPADSYANVDASAVLDWVRSQVKTRFPTDPEAFLRAYWYTAEFDPSDDRFEGQRSFHGYLQSVAGLHLRLGRLVDREPAWHTAVKAAIERCGVTVEEFEKHYEFRSVLSQKGVDARIVLDIVKLAERRVYDWGILIAGDRDLTEAVAVAQDAGARFVVAYPKGAGIATELRHLADELITIEDHELKKMFKIKKRKAGETPPVETLEVVATD